MICILKVTLVGMVFCSPVAFATPSNEVTIKQIAELVLTDRAMDLRAVSGAFGEPQLHQVPYLYSENYELYHPHSLKNSKSALQEITHRLWSNEDLNRSDMYGEVTFRFRSPCPSIADYEKALGKRADKMDFAYMPSLNGLSQRGRYTLYYLPLNDDKRLQINLLTCEVSYYSQVKSD